MRAAEASADDAGEAPRPTPGERKHPPAGPGAPWKTAVAVTLFSRAVFFAVAYAASWYLTADAPRPEAGFLDLWNRWDAVLFRRVAEFGYTDPATDPHATAFFPLFPLLMKGLHAIGLPWTVAGMVISTAATIVALAYLYRLVAEEMDVERARRAVWYLAFFPTAVFLVAPYSEALFLAGAVPAFYYARRGRWHLAALPAAVAVGTRAAGIFLLFGLVWEFVRGRDFRLDTALNALLALVVGALPLLAYSAYLAQVKGSPFYFFTDQRLGWHRQFTPPADSLRATWEAAVNPGNAANWRFAWGIEVLAAAVGLVLVIWALTRREWGYAAFMGTTLASLMTSTWYFSIPRMLLSFFPAAIFLAAATARRDRLHEYVLAVLIPIATMGVVVFTRSAWFY